MEKNNDIHQVHEAELSIWQVKYRLDSFIYNYRNMLSMEAMDAVYDIYKDLENAAGQINKLEDKCKTKDNVLKEMIKAIAELEKEKIDLEVQNDDLKKENNNLTTDTKRLSDAVEAWFNMFNDMRHKRDFLKKEYEKLEEALNDKNKLIYKLTPRKGDVGNKRVPPTGCCGCCTICTLRDICWILND